MTGLVDDPVRIDPCIRQQSSGRPHDLQPAGESSKLSGEVAVIGKLS